ncbi:MerR family transcriptional regulator [Piscibacillus halophilus]|uniref:DNA-binding transcriptional regulator, MerR family n=1 Tax=Piscibacillus halophilus TaxID=571933 RepID=A0A1H9L237_9BACI|nr:MerR family transcriptional regulator [Piscibacillus halophilus]SER05460.1 DNA-binding transcriptional regulator, MerR family [Piscibacillus halophilus]
MYQVKEVSELSGVSVRTLHHYDNIGLLQPSKVADNGYRYYNDENLKQLQQILFFKELDFSLNQIKEIMDDPEFNQKETLMNQRHLLEKKKHRLEKLINTIDETIDSMEEGKNMSNKKMFESFNMDDIKAHQEKYAKETEEKYGHTDAYKQSKERTSKYNEQDWKTIQEKSHSIYTRLAGLMDRSPREHEVQSVIGEWHSLIHDNFYECPPEMFKGLGDLYISDERFTKNIDQYGEGLASFMRDAMHIYSEQMSK